jgi:hypothetical protein
MRVADCVAASSCHDLVHDLPKKTVCNCGVARRLLAQNETHLCVCVCVCVCVCAVQWAMQLKLWLMLWPSRDAFGTLQQSPASFPCRSVLFQFSSQAQRRLEVHACTVHALLETCGFHPIETHAIDRY